MWFKSYIPVGPQTLLFFNVITENIAQCRRKAKIIVLLQIVVYAAVMLFSIKKVDKNCHWLMTDAG